MTSQEAGFTRSDHENLMSSLPGYDEAGFDFDTPLGAVTSPDIIVIGPRAGGGWGLESYFASKLFTPAVGTAIHELLQQDQDADGTPDLADDTPIPEDIVVTGQPLNPVAVEYANQQIAGDVALFVTASFYGHGYVGRIAARAGIPAEMMYLSETAIGAALSDIKDQVYDRLWETYYYQGKFVLEHGGTLEGLPDRLEREYIMGADSRLELPGSSYYDFSLL